MTWNACDLSQRLIVHGDQIVYYTYYVYSSSVSEVSEDMSLFCKFLANSAVYYASEIVGTDL